MKLLKKHQIKESTKDKAERTDAHKVQEYHKSLERIARMVAEASEITDAAEGISERVTKFGQAVKDADEREMW